MCPANEHVVQAGIQRNKERDRRSGERSSIRKFTAVPLGCSKESIQRELWIPFIPPLQQEQCLSPTPNEMLRKQTKYHEMEQLVFLVSSICGPKDGERIAAHWFCISSILFWTIFLSFFQPSGNRVLCLTQMAKYHQRRRFYIYLRRFVLLEIYVM